MIRFNRNTIDIHKQYTVCVSSWPSNLFWLGARRSCCSDPYSRSSFHWIDNTNISFDSWSGPEPDNAFIINNHQATCLGSTMDKQNVWVDDGCEEKFALICQYRINERNCNLNFTICTNSNL